MPPSTSRVGRERILEIAEELFTEYGYRAVSIRNIADACGVTNAALYYHFKNKEDLFSEVITHYASHLGNRLRKAGECCGSSQERITKIAQTYMELMSNRRSLFFLLRHNMMDLNSNENHVWMLEIYNMMFGSMEEIIQNAIQSGELRELPENYSGTTILLGMLHGVGRYQRLHGKEKQTPEDVKLIVDLFWNGIQKR